MRATAGLLMIALAGCGRLGFDERGGAPDGGGSGDGGGDAPAAGRWASVDVSANAACGITRGGELWCWGYGWSGTLGVGTVPVANPPTRVGAETDWKTVSVDYQNACGTRADGSLWCWGNNDRGALGIGQGGSGTYDQPVMVGSGYREVAAGGQFGCAISAAGQLSCWGSHDDGRLGTGGANDQPRPRPVDDTTTWEHVAAGADTACATRTDHSLWCWGRGDSGQIGDGGGVSRESPTQIGTGTAWSAVAVAADHACALDSQGGAWCWGSNNDDGIGIGVEGNTVFLVPAHVEGVPPLASIAVGDSGTCGATSGGALWCWGRDDHGQIPGADTYVETPFHVASPAIQASIGGDTACTVDGEGVLRCTGANEYGQAGAPFGEVHTPERADGRTDWAQIWAHDNHACARTTGGSLWCWGAGYVGQIGAGDTLDRQLPADTGHDLAGVVMDDDVTLGLDGGHHLYAWGYDPFADDYFASPQQELGNIAQAALGAGHICWLTTGGGGSGSAGVLACAGDNSDGQLGAGSADEIDEGVTVPGTWNHVYAGADATCATRSTGSASDDLFCWGGDGMTGTAQSGDFHFCAINEGHELWCWGHADEGQGGTSALPAGLSAPLRVGTGTDWADVACGDHFTCALKVDGTRWCFGQNPRGLLSNGRSWLTVFTVVP